MLIWKAVSYFQAQTGQNWPKAVTVEAGNSVIAEQSVLNVPPGWDKCGIANLSNPCTTIGLQDSPMVYEVKKLDLGKKCFMARPNNGAKRLQVAATKAGGRYRVELSADGRTVKFCAEDKPHGTDVIVIWSDQLVEAPKK